MTSCVVGVGVCDVTRDLTRVLSRVTEKRHHRNGIVPRLHLHDGEVDGASVDARRSARLQAIDPKRQRAKSRRESIGRRVAGTSARMIFQPDVNASAQECTGCQNDRTGCEGEPGLRNDTAHAIALYDEVNDRLLEHAQVRVDSTICRIAWRYRTRSACARVARTAGPFDPLSTRN